MDNFSSKALMNHIISIDDLSLSSNQNEKNDCAQNYAQDNHKLQTDKNHIKYSQQDDQNSRKDLSSYKEQKGIFQRQPLTEFKADHRQQIGKEYSNQIHNFEIKQKAQPESQKTSNNSTGQANGNLAQKTENLIANNKRFRKFQNSFKDYDAFDRKLVLFSFLKIQKKVNYLPNQVEAFINIDDSNQLNTFLQKNNLSNEFYQYLKEQKKYTKSLASQLKQFVLQRNPSDYMKGQVIENIYEKNKYNFANYLNRLQSEKFFKKFFEKVQQINSPESKQQVCPEIPIYHYITILRDFVKKQNNNQDQLIEVQAQISNSQENQQKQNKSQEITLSNNLLPQFGASQIVEEQKCKPNELNIQKYNPLQIRNSHQKQDNNKIEIKQNLAQKILLKMEAIELQNAENKKLQSLNSQILLDILQVLQSQREDQTKFNKLIYENIQELINNIKNSK
ncbi:hypothetical protein TTHERM_00755800 (macronuclear) [Tetrahymena thermophila SB210]|uniref:Uncharacterized protein n=1 Tax=Tetrahymena thermophila (strain SB210) TaxID=312017 RepID=I7MCJ2_TETTS|nr:hypothetical protein TTHERM_00755800 [Tetrahymena thermophila SB210]EAR84046.2 hypothetical protein TTHERM_00755800 [Tetrahymena thermophila SB210]|eukprot:XP_001031709.2 hypothetical protein TTHERM_00755800 [Tetrahymena thermophila SB210]